jgi:hypothetical protein
MACGAGGAAEMSRLRRLLRMISPAAAENEAGLGAWMELAASGSQALRGVYLGSLIHIARAMAGENVVCVADFSGDSLPVQARERGNRDLVTERVFAIAGQVLESSVRACRSGGVFGVGRFRMSRLDRPSRTLLDSVVEYDISPTGLPILVVRAYAMEEGEDAPVPPELETAPVPVMPAAGMALRVAG